MRSGGKGFIFAGVALGLVAILLVVMALAGGGGNNEADQAATEEEMVTYVSVTRDIPAHTVFIASDLQEVEVAADEVPLGTVSNSVTAVGMAHRTALRLDQALMQDQLERPGLSNDVAVGMRAFTLPVDERSALYGLVASEDYVDVVFRARVNLLRVLPSTGGYISEDGEYELQDPAYLPPDIDMPQQPAVGDAGSRVFIRDSGQQLEPVAKVMLQDLRVLRVVRPGQTFSADGQPVEQAVTDGGVAANGDELAGALILEVTLEQAEVLTFMQDENHQYQIVVRGRQDHDVVATNGVSFQLLASTADYALPLPGSMTVGAPMRTLPETGTALDDAEDVRAAPTASAPTELDPPATDPPPASPEAGA